MFCTNPKKLNQIPRVQDLNFYTKICVRIYVHTTHTHTNAHTSSFNQMTKGDYIYMILSHWFRRQNKIATWSFVYNYNAKWLIRAKFKGVLSLLTTLNSCFQVCVFPKRQYSNRHISSDTEQTQYYQYFCESVFLKEKQSENSLLSKQEIICNPKFYLNLLFIDKHSIVQRNKKLDQQLIVEGCEN